MARPPRLERSAELGWIPDARGAHAQQYASITAVLVGSLRDREMSLRCHVALAQVACQSVVVGVSLISNLVRHDERKIPATDGTPKSAFLTVHTISVELAWGCVSLGECLVRPWAPTWVTAVAHSGDAFVVSLGALLFGAYYCLVHSEIVEEASSRRTPEYVFWNHVVHFPTLFLPLLCVAAKDPKLLRAHAPKPAVVLVAAATYGVAYAVHVTRCAAAAPKRPPYAFMARLTTTRRRFAFWGSGIAVGALPIAYAAAHLVGRVAGNPPASYPQAT